MSEIVYEETSSGQFEPRPSRHQLRKMKEKLRRDEEKRADRRATIAGVSIMIAVFVLWLAAIWLGFGGGWRYL